MSRLWSTSSWKPNTKSSLPLPLANAVTSTFCPTSLRSQRWSTRILISLTWELKHPRKSLTTSMRMHQTMKPPPVQVQMASKLLLELESTSAPSHALSLGLLQYLLSLRDRGFSQFCWLTRKVLASMVFNAEHFSLLPNSADNDLSILTIGSILKWFFLFTSIDHSIVLNCFPFSVLIIVCTDIILIHLYNSHSWEFMRVIHQDASLLVQECVEFGICVRYIQNTDFMHVWFVFPLCELSALWLDETAWMSLPDIVSGQMRSDTLNYILTVWMLWVYMLHANTIILWLYYINFQQI